MVEPHFTLIQDDETFDEVPGIELLNINGDDYKIDCKAIKHMPAYYAERLGDMLLESTTVILEQEQFEA